MKFYKLLFVVFLLSQLCTKESLSANTVLNDKLPIYNIKKLTNELVVNGGLEEGRPDFGSWNVYPEIIGWHLAFGPGIEVQNNVAGAPYDGDAFVELDSHGSSGIYQLINTKKDHSYKISFAFAARAGSSPEDNIVDVLWDGRRVALIQQKSSKWRVYSFILKASSDLTWIEFQDKGFSNGLGSYLDRVSVVEILNPNFSK